MMDDKQKFEVTTPVFIGADEFMQVVYTNIPYGWRKGQAAFNGLMEVRPDLSERIRGSAIDPFYAVGSRLGPFEDWLRTNWAIEPGKGEE